MRNTNTSHDKYQVEENNNNNHRQEQDDHEEEKSNKDVPLLNSIATTPPASSPYRKGGLAASSTYASSINTTSTTTSAPTPAYRSPEHHPPKKGSGGSTLSPATSSLSGGFPSNVTRALLSRPFGRTALPNAIARKWVAQVSAPERKKNCYYYRVLVQRRNIQPNHHHNGNNYGSSNESQLGSHGSFTNAFTWRTWPEFQWLERQLRNEFHGGLLIPPLPHHPQQQQQQHSGSYYYNRGSSNASTLSSSLASETMPMPNEPLTHWLNDVLNGIRGQGEWVLAGHDPMESESMEGFLYKTGHLVDDVLDADGNTTLGDDTYPGGSASRGVDGGSLLDCTKRMGGGGDGGGGVDGDGDGEEDDVGTAGSLAHQFFTFVARDLCGAGGTEVTGPSSSHRRNHHDGSGNASNSTSLAGSWSEDGQRLGDNGGGADDDEIDTVDAMPRNPMLMCSSSGARRAATASLALHVSQLELDVESIASSTPAHNKSAGGGLPNSALLLRSQILHDLACLLANYRKSAFRVFERLQSVREYEDLVGQNWRKCAAALSALFAYEKEAESAKLGHTVNKEHMPFRKIHKSKVDDCLKALAQQKQERSLASLDALELMLGAYLVDLNSVGPSVDAFRIGAEKLQSAQRRQRQHIHRRPSQGGDNNGNHRQTDTKTALQNERLQRNELILQHSLTAMCRATSIRVARMAYAAWTTASKNGTLVNKAASALHAKVQVPQESISKMLRRHLKEEKEDAATELELVQKLIRITGEPPSAQGPDVSANLNEGQERLNVAGSRALDLARERVGKWDSQLSLALLEAVGIDDPHVRMEETTRDLRLVRKYAIGLREHLNRCIEAIQLLLPAYSRGNNTASSISEGSAGSSTTPHDRKTVHDKRTELLDEMVKLFSGRPIQDRSMSEAVLSGAGVDLTDPLGWMQDRTDTTGNDRYQPAEERGPRGGGSQQAQQQRLGLGELALKYEECRDAQSEWLLSSMYDLLLDYFERVQVIESHVYMEAVGIQLEKHFNQKRTGALSTFERRTDLTQALNVARKKRLVKLVHELQVKLDELGTTGTPTTVKETKAIHLESKALKSELHELAQRRLTRARESSTERVVTLISLWAKEEESSTTAELQALGNAISSLERAVGSVGKIDAIVYRVPDENSPSVGGRSL